MKYTDKQLARIRIAQQHMAKIDELLAELQRMQTTVEIQDNNKPVKLRVVED